MEFLQEITLELNSNSAYTTVGAKQGDSSSRVVKIHIVENGRDWKIPLGVTASYRVRKPDGYAIWNDAVIDSTENVIYITLTEQTLAAAGRAYADILLTSGVGDDRQVLSTISFIIIIMASPDIAKNVSSSDEFSRILDLTENADVILNEAEAWAAGTKVGVPVTEDAFSYTIEGGTFTCVIDEDVFHAYVGESPGYTRYFLFTCTGIPEGETENHWNVTYGDVTLENIDLSDYGITIVGSPLQSNIIRVVVTDSDIQYQNNAKYYADQAALSRQAIDDLTVSAETVADLEHGGTARVIKTIEDGVVNFHFEIPRGDVGNVSFMSFDIDLDSGELIMYKPDYLDPQVDFSLNNNDGNLYIEILN